MNTYYKVTYKGKEFPNWYRYIPKDYVWDNEDRQVEINKGISVCEMAFLDHGQPLVPDYAAQKINAHIPAYLKDNRANDLLVAEGGLFMPLLEDMVITDVALSAYYPIQKGAAIICENDAFDKSRGNADYRFKTQTNAESLHYMFSFQNRSDEEVISAFKLGSCIAFSSSYTSIKWFEKLLRCYIVSRVSVPIVGNSVSHPELKKRQRLFMELASNLGIEITLK